MQYFGQDDRFHIAAVIKLNFYVTVWFRRTSSIALRVHLIPLMRELYFG